MPASLAIMQEHDGKKFKESVKADPAVSFGTESDYAITRARHTRRPPRTFTLGFTLISDAEKQQLQSFYDGCRGAASIITGWTHPITGVETPVRFRPKTVPEFTYKGRGGNHLWDATIQLEEV